MTSVSGPTLIFTSQLASMLRSKLPLVDALEHLAKDTPDRRLRTAIRRVLDNVKLGIDFADALETQSATFGGIYTSIIRAGMETGRLEDAATNVSEYLEQASRIRTKLRNALIYPLVLFAGLIVTMNLMVFFILPRFEKMFSQFSKGLPAPTEMLLAFGEFYSSHLPQIIAVIVLSTVLASTALATRQGRTIWDRRKLQIPVFGEVWRLAALAQFTRTMSLQVDSSVNVVRALRLSAPATGNLYIADRIEQVAEDIERGSGLSEALGHHALFSGVVQQMASVGEQTGQLNEMLESVSSYYDRLWLQRIETAVSIANPVMTALAGILIAGMMVAAFLPVFDLAGASML